MVEGETSDLYKSDKDTWSATSTIHGLVEEPPVDSHPPPNPVLARSYPKLCQESLACIVF
jgi:hypothetical protein